MTAPIVVDKLTRRFGSFVAVDQVSFQVNQGEIFGYLGANGAGKSTTIKMLIGLLAVSDGRAEINGYDVRTDLAKVRHSIGYVSQRFSLYLDLSARHNLEFFAGCYGLSGREAKTRIGAALEWADLTDRDKVAARDLPGGIRQRLALASAMIHEPSLLFLDEPTAGVSPDSRRTFWRAIRELSDAGKTVFVTTHHLDEAEFCHRVGLMVDGELVALDTPPGLKRTFVPGKMYKLRGEGLRPTEIVAMIERTPGLISTEVYGLSVHVRFEAKSNPERLQKIFASKKIEMIPVEPSLEDVFLEVASRASTSSAGAAS